MGSAAPEKLNPNQTSFKMISSTITGALSSATNPRKAFFFVKEKRENCGGELPPFRQTSLKISPKLGALPTKNLPSPQSAPCQVSPSEDGWNSWNILET